MVPAIKARLFGFDRLEQLWSGLLLTCKSTLRRLKLKDCYRVDDKAVEVIVKAELTLLESLDLQRTVLTQYGLQLIGCKLASIVDTWLEAILIYLKPQWTGIL